jgi:flagellar hook-associated protein 2
MATGSITTLGLGSGLELQNILDQLKDADRASITAKENQKTQLQEKITAYNQVNAKLFNIKSDTLSLSLESDFLKTSAQVSDEEVATASANDGIAAASYDLEVTRKARYNSWQSVGVENRNAVIYTAPETGITNPTESFTTESQTYDILYGAAESQQTISVTVGAGSSLEQIADAVNTSDANQDADGKPLVRASLAENNGQYYIRMSAVAGGDSVDEQVSLSGFDYIKTDTTFSVARTDNDDPMYISLAPGATYSQTVDAINSAADNPGVTAAIIDTGTSEDPFRLTLTSNATGENRRIAVQNLPMTEVNGADGDSLNAAFTVNGVSYQRQSNEAINDVISGVTLNLKKTGESTVAVQKNTDVVKDKILSLVDNFNDLISLVKGEQTDTETTDAEDDTANPLENDYTINSMTSKLQTLFTTATDISSAYKSLADIGLEINRDGTLAMDEDTLDQALASDPDGVFQLFVGDADAGVSGLGNLLNDGITDMISASGVVTTEINEAETRMDRLDKQIETATIQLDKRYETMTASFVRLDSYIQQLNAESEYMQSMIDSFKKTTEK